MESVSCRFHDAAVALNTSDAVAPCTLLHARPSLEVTVTTLLFLLSAKYNGKGMNVSEMAKALGRRGGRARGKRLSAADKKRIASLGGKARFRSIQATRRIVDNLRYATVVSDLRRRSTNVKRLKTFGGPLPGIYPARLSNA